MILQIMSTNCFVKKKMCEGSTESIPSVTGSKTLYADVVTHNKRLIIQEDMASDVHNLAQLLKDISSRDRHGSDITLNALQRALTEVLAEFPVYRTYISDVVVSDNDRKYILDAVDRAIANFPALLHGLTFCTKIPSPGFSRLCLR